TSISQADCILVVGLAESSPNIGEYERFLVGMKSTARKELVLLHVDRYCPPRLTRAWLRVGQTSSSQSDKLPSTSKKCLRIASGSMADTTTSKWRSARRRSPCIRKRS